MCMRKPLPFLQISLLIDWIVDYQICWIQSFVRIDIKLFHSQVLTFFQIISPSILPICLSCPLLPRGLSLSLTESSSRSEHHLYINKFWFPKKSNHNIHLNPILEGRSWDENKGWPPDSREGSVQDKRGRGGGGGPRRQNRGGPDRAHDCRCRGQGPPPRVWRKQDRGWRGRIRHV